MTNRSNLSRPPQLSRRDWLASAAGASFLAAASQPADAVADQPQTLAANVDAHVHVWTPDTKRYPLAKGYKKSDMRPPSFTPEQLFAHTRPAGVGRIVLIQMSYYRYDNSYMLEMMRKHKGVFSGVAVIDENDDPVATMRTMKRQGVRGFRIRPQKSTPDRWLATDGMRKMWAAGAEHNLAMCCLINPEFVPSVARMCRRYPRTPVVIDHFARIGIDGKIRESDLKNLCDLARHKNVSVKISAYYALGKKQAPYTDLLPMIRRLLDAYGRERLMWASDGPFQVVNGHKYQPSIDLIRRRADFLSAADRSWLLRKTAERVFFN